MERYIALLRGINVSGKNKIAMSELKSGFLELGLEGVATYLNSGNVIFSSTATDVSIHLEEIESMIKGRFDLEIPVFLISQRDLNEILQNSPDWWGDENKEIYDNLIFMISPLSYEEFYSEIGNPKAESEKVQHYGNAIFWSFSRKDYQKTNWWSKTANSNVSDKITIRTANTVRKMVEM